MGSNNKIRSKIQKLYVGTPKILLRIAVSLLPIIADRWRLRLEPSDRIAAVGCRWIGERIKKRLRPFWESRHVAN